MAGGPRAAVAPCWRCLGPADRVSEGLETDSYACAGCGYRFGIDFDAAGPPAEPLWPITPERRAEFLRFAEAMGWKKPDRPD